MTCGYSGAAHKKYKTLEDARLAWIQGPTGPITEYAPPPEPVLRRPSTPPPPSQDDSSSDESLASPSRSPSPGYDAYNPPKYVNVPVPRAQTSATAESLAPVPASPPVSPISSISSISYLSGLSISSGTVTPRKAATRHASPHPRPTPSSPSIASKSSRTPLSPSPSKAGSSIMSRTTSCGPGRSREPQPIKIATTSRTSASERKQPIPAMSTAGGTAQDSQSATTLASLPLLKGKAPAASPSVASPSRSTERQHTLVPQHIEVREDKEVYVVVRGDQPGVYLDRHTALLMVGTSPGMKIVKFRSKKAAAWYFVQEYMAGRVGIPVVVVDDD
ncbi:hypothetical protein FKP32DRAFT_1682506 [Trametes sanguinea]|nr:hypothetical protein FKP32DRAFT_1682506 [Trametes sanguinea]